MAFITRDQVEQRPARSIGTSTADPWALALLAFIYFKTFFTTQPFSRYLDDGMGGDYGEGSLQSKLSWLGIFAVACFIIYRNRDTALELFRRTWFFLIPMAWFLLTALWSVDFGLTVRRSFQVAIMYGIAFGIAAGRPSPSDFMKTTALMLGMFMFFSLASVFVVPHLAKQSGEVFLGVYNRKNAAGYAAGVTFIVWFFLMMSTIRFEMKIIGLFGSLMWLFFLVGTRSKTALGLALLTPAIAVGLYYVLRLDLAWRTMAYVAAVVVLGILVWFVLYINWTVADVGILLFDDLTFTDRTFLWEYVWKAIQEHPILGHGFGAFWLGGSGVPNRLDVPDAGPWTQIVTSSHNGYLNLWLENGIIGLIICGTVMVIACRGLLDLMKQSNQSNLNRWIYAGVAALLLYLLGRDTMETSLYKTQSGATLLLFLFFHLIWLWRWQSEEEWRSG